MILHGVMRTVRWPSPPDGDYRERIEFSTDGLGDWNVGYRTSAQESPAVCIAWNPSTHRGTTGPSHTPKPEVRFI